MEDDVDSLETCFTGKIDYQNGDCYRSLSGILGFKVVTKRSTLCHGLTKMMRKFEATRTLKNSARKGTKVCCSTLVVVVDDVVVQVKEDRSQTIGHTSVQRIASSVDQPPPTIRDILLKVLRYFPYKLQIVQKLLPDDLDSQQTF
ncbi:hypothetical protein TNCV_2448701 [Trichonephila clavipes]|uniref:Uncharacterized protein n=1 Tax=Trichonephila clavipes TaxID=2585209 RepID=A0A8X6VHA0_TRICX|nr:hypothetical protein TNCV_2448701 [Trichonephila clavipes]